MLDRVFFGRHLNDDEEVVAIIHKHWFMGLKELFLPTLSFVGSWGLLYYAPFKAMFLVVALWSVVSIVWWFRNFFNYYLDVWIITDHGIIDLEWHGWFHRQSSRVLYSDIHGVSYEVMGISGTLCRYGTIEVEKISTGAVISLDYVPRPREVESLILRNMEEYIHGKNLKDSRHVQELLAEMIAEQVQLQDLEDDDDEYEDDDDEDEDN